MSIRVTSDRTIMLLYRGILSSLLFVYTIESTALALKENISSHSLEDIITLKLKTAAQLRENFVKVLLYLPKEDYEIYQSVKLIRNYFRDEGSLLESLHILPSIAYLPILKQLNEILRSMSNTLPRYVLPAIGIIRGAVNGWRGSLDIQGIFRPHYGPLKADLLYRIPSANLPIVAKKFTPPCTSINVEGPWPILTGQTMACIASGIIKPSGKLIAEILDSVKINYENPEVRQSTKHLVQILRVREDELKNLTITEDPYEFLRNTVNLIGRREYDEQTWNSAQTLLPYLNKPAEFCSEKIGELEEFYVYGKLNYSLLLSRDKFVRNSESGRTLLEEIQRSDFINQAMEEFHCFEYLKTIDLVVATVSHMRRHQANQSFSSEALENVYSDLMKYYRPEDWKIDALRNSGRLSTALRGMLKEKNSPRMRRLVSDILATIDKGVAPESWREALALMPSSNCNGPSCTVINTLRALNDFSAIKDSWLLASVTEFLFTWQEDDESVNHCLKLLHDEFPTNRSAKIFDDSGIVKIVLNADDLLQAVKGLVHGSSDYTVLEKFLEDPKLEKNLGEVIDLHAHPTRGRLLAWLFQKAESSNSVEENIRKLAGNLVDSISQEGYGAGLVEHLQKHGLYM